MRLLHLESLRFEDCFDGAIPPYAILSHRWGPQEISYKDMRKKRNLHGLGYDKILGFRAFTLKQRRKVFPSGRSDFFTPDLLSIEWGWIDTCCIDKTSSAELSEAINSMCRWYEKSAVCCVYLSDVSASVVETSEEFDEFSKSQWFTRGWTLQELLAPQDVLFCNASWKVLGHKCRIKGHWYLCPERSGDILNAEIARWTNIEASLLTVSINQIRRTTSIACRMSWAAHRKTSRVEDMAYCLLGLFDIHMPPMYGEGQKAFQRLQEELIRRSNDHSIFAWAPQANVASDVPYASWIKYPFPVLATHPVQFAGSSDVKVAGHWRPHARFMITNTGLELRAKAMKYYRPGLDRYLYLVRLNCEGPDMFATHLALVETGPWLCRAHMTTPVDQLGECLDNSERLFYVEMKP